MRYFIMMTVVATSLASSQAVFAESACGGTIVYNADCANSKKGYSTTCCPEGYTAVGAAYTDIKKQDHMDAVAIVCRSSSGSVESERSDFSNGAPQQYNCNDGDEMIGLYVKDVMTEAGNTRDSVDGVTPLCRKKGSDVTYKANNPDISGGREGVELGISKSSQKVVGIAYKELDEGSSDRADCATPIVK